MQPYSDVCIQLGSDVDRQYLLDRKRDLELGIDTHVAYVYYLEDESIPYPNKSGNVVYIGEAGRASENTGKRFGQHISSGPNKGGDSGTIYSLSRYYWQGKRIRLKIFIMDSREIRKSTERELLRAHVKEYGALPICQGTTGDNYKTTELELLTLDEKTLDIFEPSINKRTDGNTN